MNSSSPDHSDDRRQWLVLALALLVVVVLASRCWGFFHDDAYITLRYAQRWLAGLGLNWSSGPPVEGYTHPLWLFQITGLGWLGAPLPAAARGLGLLYLLAIFALWARRGARPIALLVLVTIPGVVVWTVSGMETLSFAFFCLLGCALLERVLEEPAHHTRAAAVGCVFFLAALTRPEGAGLGAIAIGWIVIQQRWRSAIAATLGFGVPLALFLAFRLWFYGELLSTSSIAKLGGFGALFGIGGGLHYVERHAMLSVVAVVYFGLAISTGERRSRSWAPLSMAAALLGVTIAAGGDHMPYGRFLVPIFALLAWAAAVAGRSRVRLRGLSPTGVSWKLALLTNLALWALVSRVLPDPAAAYGEPVGRFLSRHLPAGSSVAVATAGSTAYYAPELEFIDVLGLNDPVVARRRVSAIQTAWQLEPGHQKGDGAYVLSRRPDVLVLGPALGFLGHAPNRWFLTDLELIQDPRFAERYEPFAFVVPSGSLEGLRHVEDRLWSLSTGLPLSSRPEALGRALAEDPEHRFMLIAFVRRDSARVAELTQRGTSLQGLIATIRPEFVPVCAKLDGLRGRVACEEGPAANSRELGNVGVPRHVLLLEVGPLATDALGAYGRPESHTPHLDALADAGIVFEFAVAADTCAGAPEAAARAPLRALFSNAGFRAYSASDPEALLGELREHFEPDVRNFIQLGVDSGDWGDDRQASADLDAGIGGILDLLDAHKVLSETIVAVVGRRGERRTSGEAPRRVPLIFHWENHLRAERRADPAQAVDVPPTLLSLAGIATPDDLAGFDLFSGGRVGATAPCPPRPDAVVQSRSKR